MERSVATDVSLSLGNWRNFNLYMSYAPARWLLNYYIKIQDQDQESGLCILYPTLWRVHAFCIQHLWSSCLPVSHEIKGVYVICTHFWSSSPKRWIYAFRTQHGYETHKIHFTLYPIVGQTSDHKFWQDDDEPSQRKLQNVLQHYVLINHGTMMKWTKSTAAINTA